MVYEARIGEILGITPKGTSERITALIKRFGFETRLPCPAGEVLDAIKADKKILDGRLNLILLRDIGASVIHPITLRELKSVMVV
jgi:3-dehydroquinate synthase